MRIFRPCDFTAIYFVNSILYRIKNFNKLWISIYILIFGYFQGTTQQSIDSSQSITTFSGSLGITNNGFSIIPTFSLNSPASIVQLSWKKEKFSIDPDVRLTLDARKGGVLLWIRYQAVQTRRFQFRAGFHPAMNLQIRQIEEGGVASEITQMRRFLAWELAPNLKLNSHFSLNLYYLQGNGLQNDGPRTSHFVNFSTPISNISLGRHFRFSFIPAIYYLNLDGFKGTYFTSTTIIRHASWPFSLQSSLNKTISSDIPGNRDFMWNVSLHYHFTTKYKKSA